MSLQIRLRRRFRYRNVLLALGLVVVLLIAGSGFVLYDHVQSCDGQDWIRKSGPSGECVGVSDGSYTFDPELAEVTNLIDKENRRVEGSGKPWVAIAYTEPMTHRTDGTAANDRGPEVIRQALEGAYLAQMELNHHGGRGTTPQIKLLLANSGQGGEQWSPLVAKLKEMARDKEQRLVAVAGFGQSVDTTARAVDALRSEDPGPMIPMVGSTVAADDLAKSGPAFFRVSSPNADQTSIAVDYLKALQQKAMSNKKSYRVDIVKDIRKNDTYIRSLYRGFESARNGKGLKLEPGGGYQFLSGTESAGNALSRIAERVCRPERRLDAVYFAGRGRELRLFIEALAAPGRNCPLTVLSGSSALGVFFDPVEPATKAGGDVFDRWARSSDERKAERLRVLYTAYAHPEGAAAIYPDVRDNPYPEFQKRYVETFKVRGALQSGQAMMGHDAVITLGQAIRDATQGASDGTSVDPAAVQNMLLQIDAGAPLHGLSGPIAFDRRGNPIRKPMALVELRPERDRHYTYRATVRPGSRPKAR